MQLYCVMTLSTNKAYEKLFWLAHDLLNQAWRSGRPVQCKCREVHFICISIGKPTSCYGPLLVLPPFISGQDCLSEETLLWCSLDTLLCQIICKHQQPSCNSSTIATQISESSSGLFGGVALDDLGLGIRQVAFMMAGGGALMSVIWLPYAIYNYVRYRRKVLAEGLNTRPEQQTWGWQIGPRSVASLFPPIEAGSAVFTDFWLLQSFPWWVTHVIYRYILHTLVAYNSLIIIFLFNGTDNRSRKKAYWLMHDTAGAKSSRIA